MWKNGNVYLRPWKCEIWALEKNIRKMYPRQDKNIRGKCIEIREELISDRRSQISREAAENNQFISLLISIYRPSMSLRFQFTIRVEYVIEISIYRP